MAEDVNPHPPHIDVSWDGANTMHLIVEGTITSDHLVMAAFMLTRTASAMVDNAVDRARDIDREATAVPSSKIIPVHSRLPQEGRA